MKNITVYITVLSSIVIASLISNTNSEAADLNWSGVYRIEGYHIKNSELNDRKREKNYGQHHLILRPKIVAGDGLTIYGQFNLLNANATGSPYANSQFGQIIGSGVGDGTGSSADDSNVVSERQQSENFEITHLYLSYVQEFGALLVGRAPLHFGLGITHNAGRGLFDHWLDTRDMVAYKVLIGNLSLTPMIGKVNEGSLHRNDDVTDYMIHVQYENPETDLEMGIFYQIRKTNGEGNDAPQGTNPGDVFGGAATDSKSVDMQTLSVYALKDTERFRFGVEAGFANGKTGVIDASGNNVSLNGYGVAGEFEWRPASSAWNFGAKFGIASGDDPDTDSKFEGYIFDRNYDVGFLMFNHPLGQDDFLRTSLVNGGPQSGVVTTADTEALSNAIYFSPYTNFRWSEQWGAQIGLTAGWLDTEPIVGVEGEKDLGFEVDLSLDFSPKKGVIWVNQLGLLFPGKAFEADGTYEAKFMYGITSKAAISF